MAKQVKLSARPRSEVGRNSVKQLRHRGAIPAVIYGSKNQPENLEVSLKEIQALLAKASGENVLVELEINQDGKTTNRLSLIQEVQHHPVRGEVLHVDFLAVSATETIQADIPIEAQGEAEGVKVGGGILEQGLRTLTIECLPQNLPDLIRVDVSALKLGESLHVSAIQLPEGVTAVSDADLTVFSISEPNVDVETSSAAPSAPEVIKEKKSDDAGDKK